MVSTNVIVSEGNTVNPGNSRGLSDEGKRKMSSNFEHAHEENEDYGKKFRPDREIYVVKKDGSKELFNVQKVISAVHSTHNILLFDDYRYHIWYLQTLS